MEIKKIVSLRMDQNCYLIKNGGKGFLIDPGLNTSKIKAECEGTEIEYVLLTHCHFDHIYSAKKMDIKIVSSKLCSENIKREDMVLEKHAVIEKGSDIVMEDGEVRDFCGISVKCICTPGHTDGGVCYLIGNNLFSGDTLFYESIGRCDLKSGNIKALENSIKNKIYTLPEATLIYPGHGRETSVGFEKKNNLYIRG